MTWDKSAEPPAEQAKIQNPKNWKCGDWIQPKGKCRERNEESVRVEKGVGRGKIKLGMRRRQWMAHKLADRGAMLPKIFNPNTLQAERQHLE